MSLEALRVKAVNYGSKSKPRLTIEAALSLRLGFHPNEVHSSMVDEKLISFTTVPVHAVVNFRGSSVGDAPYYKALVEYGGSVYEYRVDAVYVGGVANVTYNPSVVPSVLKPLHPAVFKTAGVKVLEFKLSNYRFTSGLRHYEEAAVEVRGIEDSGSAITALFKEAGLTSPRPPCSQALYAFERSTTKLGGPTISSRILAELGG